MHFNTDDDYVNTPSHNFNDEFDDDYLIPCLSLLNEWVEIQN